MRELEAEAGLQEEKAVLAKVFVFIQMQLLDCTILVHR